MRRVKKACVSSSAIASRWSTQPSRVRLRLKVRSPMAGESNATWLRRREHPSRHMARAVWRLHVTRPESPAGPSCRLPRLHLDRDDVQLSGQELPGVLDAVDPQEHPRSEVLDLRLSIRIGESNPGRGSTA